MLPQIESLNVGITFFGLLPEYKDQSCLTLSKHISSILFWFIGYTIQSCFSN